MTNPEPRHSTPAWTVRLRDLLGAPLSELTEDHLRGAAKRGLREDEELDFKQTLYGGTDSHRKELAADIAAFANHRGGVIIFGVEDTDGAATNLTPVELSEGEELRMRQVSAANVAPFVPFEIFAIRSKDDAALAPASGGRSAAGRSAISCEPTGSRSKSGAASCRLRI
jgi:hypothetical protein